MCIQWHWHKSAFFHCISQQSMGIAQSRQNIFYQWRGDGREIKLLIQSHRVCEHENETTLWALFIWMLQLYEIQTPEEEMLTWVWLKTNVFCADTVFIMYSVSVWDNELPTKIKKAVLCVTRINRLLICTSTSFIVNSLTLEWYIFIF